MVTTTITFLIAPPQAAHIDTHEVRMAAISAVVDLLMRHGLASFITSPQAEELDNRFASYTSSLTSSTPFTSFISITSVTYFVTSLTFLTSLTLVTSFTSPLPSGTGSCAASRCADTADSGSNVDYLDSDITTRGATLTQSELNSQGGNSVVAILTKVSLEPSLDLYKFPLLQLSP